ncbi:RHOMBOID-like protein 10 [Carex rostrata]
MAPSMPPFHSLLAPHVSSENSSGQISTVFAGVQLDSTLRRFSSDYLRLLHCSQSQLRSKLEELKSGSILMWSNMCSKKCLVFGSIQSGVRPQFCLIARKEFDREEGFLSSIESLVKNFQRNNSNKRFWTDVLLGANLLAYGAQVASKGRLVLWGAKVNSLIREGQIWRLATSSFLHANILHLMVNCYSLNSIGPPVERLVGPSRFLEIYFSSALASSLMSYHFCPAPSLGASGAVCGLVGAYAVYIWRNKNRIRSADKQLERIGSVIALNMVIGLTTKGIDNWGHLGGLLGGAAVSWYLNRQ